MAATSLAASEAETPVSRKSALDRPGLHHVHISGRIVSPGGDPLSGIRLRLTSGRPAALPVRETVSAADGRFAFFDVSCPYTPLLRWQSSERWSPGTASIDATDFESVDLGEIQLVPETSVRLAVETIGGAALKEDLSEALSIGVKDLSSDEYRGARKSGDSWLIRDIPFESGRWSITIDTDPTEYFDGEFRIEKGRQDQFFLLRLRRDLLQADDSGELTGPVGVTKILAPEIDLERSSEASGKIVGPDGSAIGGAVVGVAEFLLDMVPAYTITAETGEFEFHYPASRCRSVAVSYLRARDAFPLGKVDEKACDEDRRSGRTRTVPSALQLQFEVEGVKPDQTRAFWWHRDLGWIRFFALHPWLSLSPHFSSRILVKLEAIGYLPVLRELTVPSLPDLKEKPQDSIGAEFGFDPDVTRELVVLGSGNAITGATVDVESILGLSRDRRVPLGTYQTDSAGKLRLSGGHDTLVEIFVGAPGFEPGRAIWEAGATLRLELVPRSFSLTFPDLRPGQVAHIDPVGQWRGGRLVRADHGPPQSIDIGAGDYEVVIQDPRSGVVGYQRVSGKPGEKLDLDTSIDQRPRLIVQYPESGWTCSVTHSAPPSAPSGWAIYSSSGPAATGDLTAAQLERESAREAAFRLSRAGLFHIEIRRRGWQHALWRELQVSPGETLRIEAPKTEAVLHGSMNTYDGATGFSFHGWAGPRLQLVSDDPARWSVTVPHPHREEDMTFTVPSLPSGSYHLYQHLIGKPANDQPSDGKYVRTFPINAWGGIPVILEAGQTTALRDFSEYPYRDLPVTVLDSRGRPLDGATLRVRDRMSEAWRQVAEGPTTLAYASDPIPYPPAARVKKGQATLPSIRAGRLELLIELDDGRVQSLAAEIDSAQPLTLRMPEGGAK